MTKAPELRFVADGDLLDDALAALEGDVVGVDVERADAHRYYRRAALIQVGVSRHCLLIDAVAIAKAPQLDTFLATPRLAVLHAADNDLVPLARSGVYPAPIADTAIAAALLGKPRGLERLLEEELGVQLDGNKDAFQRADWEQRPLPADMLHYAAGDVVHLPQLWAKLSAALTRSGRMSWYDQELDAMLARSGVDERDWRRVKGAGRLDPKQRARLRALWHARETIAQDADLAPNHLLHESLLLDFAQNPPRTDAQLIRRSQRHRNVVRPHAEQLLDALHQPVVVDVEEPSARGEVQRDRELERALASALRKARAERAESLGIEAGVLCPAKTLSAVIAGDPSDAEALCTLAQLRPWQREVLAEVLWEAYSTTLLEHR